MKKTVLCYIKQNESFLMLYRNKKENDINEGKWIGVGGHVETNETVVDALYREVKEETGLSLLDHILHGEIYFEDRDIKETMYLFSSSSFIGELIDCDEGHLQWVPIKKINQLPMWEGDYLFLNKLINNDPFFKMKIIYENGHLVASEIIDAYN